MPRFRVLSTLAVGVAAAMALGGLVMFARSLPDSEMLLSSVVVFVLVLAAVGGGVVYGSRVGGPETAYW